MIGSSDLFSVVWAKKLIQLNTNCFYFRNGVNLFINKSNCSLMESNNYMYSNFFYFYSININTKNILSCQDTKTFYVYILVQNQIYVCEIETFQIYSKEKN